MNLKFKINEKYYLTVNDGLNHYHYSSKFVSKCMDAACILIQQTIMLDDAIMIYELKLDNHSNFDSYKEEKMNEYSSQLRGLMHIILNYIEQNDPYFNNYTKTIKSDENITELLLKKFATFVLPYQEWFEEIIE